MRCPWQLMIYPTCSRNKLIVINYSGFQHLFSIHMAPRIHSSFIYKVFWNKWCWWRKRSHSKITLPFIYKRQDFEWVSVQAKLQYWMHPRTDQAQVSGSNRASRIAPFTFTFRLITEVKWLLHITSQKSDSTIAVGTSTPGINDVDTYYDHKAISISHLKLHKSMLAAAISHMYSLLLNFLILIIFLELVSKQKYNTMPYLPSTPLPYKPQCFGWWCSALHALALPAYWETGSRSSCNGRTEHLQCIKRETSKGEKKEV